MSKQMISIKETIEWAKLFTLPDALPEGAAGPEPDIKIGKEIVRNMILDAETASKAISIVRI